MAAPPDAAESALEEELSRPAPPETEALAGLPGDILVLGAGGKMGPSLVRLARRASDAAGSTRRVIAVARFGDPAARASIESAGIQTVACDLLDPDALAALPDSPNVVLMAGQKFGSTGDPAATWATNVHLPGLVARRFRQSRIVAFSTGNVYPLWSAGTPGPTEEDPVGPVGEYAQSALGRERVLAYLARRHDTPMTILRLNYANEPRYGVIRDLADRILSGRAIDLAMGHVNLIWQRDANAVALRALHHVEVPPFVVNVTGSTATSVRWLAERVGERLGVRPTFEGVEGDTALLSDASRCAKIFGPPPTSVEAMVDRVADWVGGGGRSLGKPTQFEEREGTF